MPSTSPTTVVFAVATPYAWDVVESLLRAGQEVTTVDNLGTADGDLPGRTATEDVAGRPFVLGTASPRGRAAASEAALADGLGPAATLVDPTAIVATTARLSHGVYVNAGAVVAAKTRLECHANINRSASVGHHCRIGRFAHLGPGAILAGGVDVGPGAFVGAGATVLPGVTLGEGALVGAGAVVTRDVDPGAVVVGNPAVPTGAPITVQEVLPCPQCSTP